MHQVGPQIGVATLRDPPELHASAGAGLAWHQPEEGRELPPAPELPPVAEGGRQGRRGKRADPGDGRQAPTHSVAAVPLPHLPVELGDPVAQLLQHRHQYQQRLARHRRQARVGRILHHGDQVRDPGPVLWRGHADLVPKHVRANAPITPLPPKRRGRPLKQRRNDA